MGNSALISVIVPVYNVSEYVEQCISSIVLQSYDRLEIIVVDDGSTDGSSELCDSLSEADERIVVLHKENGGLSDARNYGLARCHGEWVSFIDSDDYVSPVFIEALYRAAIRGGCPIAAIPSGKHFKDGCDCELVTDVSSVAPEVKLSSHEVQRLMLYQALDTGAPWRLYKRELLGDDLFPKGLYYEDLASVYNIIHKVDQVAVVDCRGLYAYRLRSTSIIRQAYRPIKAQSALQISRQLYEDISQWYPDLVVAASSRCFSVCRMVFAQIPTGSGATEESDADREKLWSVLKSHRKVILFDKDARKRERLAAAIACLGKNAFSLFCKCARKRGLMR